MRMSTINMVIRNAHVNMLTRYTITRPCLGLRVMHCNILWYVSSNQTYQSGDFKLIKSGRYFDLFQWQYFIFGIFFREFPVLNLEVRNIPFLPYLYIRLYYTNGSNYDRTVSSLIDISLYVRIYVSISYEW